MLLDEAAFRELLDPGGLLAPGHEASFPAPDDAYLVFSLRADARFDVAEHARHAERFVRSRLGATVDKRYGDVSPSRDAVRIVLAPVAATAFSPGARVCWGRPRSDDDLRRARAAENLGAGLADLAARCPHVWLVEAEGEDDPLALRLATILAGVFLGPILAPHAKALLGPKSARERLERALR
jgi:hypothetical protein